MEASCEQASAATAENVVQQVLLFKTSGQRWGFRLTGGADFGTPVTVIKVSKGGVAERAGLRVGDLLLGVDEVSLATMTHDAASKLVLDRGDKFTVTLVRGTFEVPALPPRQVPPPPPAAAAAQAQCVGEPLDPAHLPPLLAHIIAAGVALNEPITEQQAESGAMSQPITEQQAESGAMSQPITEQLAESGALTQPITEQLAESGALTQPITEQQTKEEPQPAASAEQQSVATNEAVVQGVEGTEGVEGETPKVDYTEEEIAEMMSGCAEVLQGVCIGVDFQKLPPDTDIMRSSVLDAILSEGLAPAPKKPSTFNQRPRNPRPKTKQELEPRPPPYDPRKYVCQKVAKPAEQPATEEPSPPDEAEPVTETAELGAGTTELGAETAELGAESAELGAESAEATEPTEVPAEPTAATEGEAEGEVVEGEVQEMVEGTELEQQLGEIQRQLAAIIQLPAEIQQHLTFIQEQLAKVLAQRKAEEDHEAEPEADEETPPEQPQEEQEALEGEQEAVEGEQEAVEETQEAVEEAVEQVVEEAVVEEEKQQEPEEKRDIAWRRDSPPRRRPFFPLTPAPRPLRLPAGRIWSAPRDVYTEQFIADTLSGHEEVLADGHTLGVDFHKFDLGYEHLKNSKVYALVHEQDEGSAHAPRRLSKAHAAQDYIVPAASEP